MASFFSKAAIVAGSGFNRWLIPPAALAIHLCIGQVYAFSVFRIPMTQLVGVNHSAPGDWERTQVFWAFTLAIVFLGLSAAFFGRWVERVGPRVSGLTSAACWSGGFFLSAIAVETHQLWLLCLGYGVVGGCGLGLGYITPVSTLIRWFPDRRGMATGMAIMGFGGGAMVASPLSEWLMRWFSGPQSNGVSQTLWTLGALYGVVMVVGALGFRVPPEPAGAKPSGDSHDPHPSVDPVAATRHVSFALLWVMLFLNVTAGIGILDVASPMIQEMFPGEVGPVAAAGFVGLLSLFNLLGRFFWSSLSDRWGRRFTYGLFLSLGPLLYLSLPFWGQAGSTTGFVASLALIMSMYGGVFAAIPAYLSDLFGTRFVGAIHGRLLTAWSCAGVAGPALMNFLHKWRVGQEGSDPARAYDPALWLVGAVLCLGWFANLWVRSAISPPTVGNDPTRDPKKEVGFQATNWPWIWLIPAWIAVGAPLLWGVSMTIRAAMRLFL